MLVLGPAACPWASAACPRAARPRSPPAFLRALAACPRAPLACTMESAAHPRAPRAWYPSQSSNFFQTQCWWETLHSQTITMSD